jgi:hypothetical protein
MSSGTTPGCPDLSGLVGKTVPRESDCYNVKKKLRSVLQELNFIKEKKGLKLQFSDPSYKLRYLYACNFWIERTGDDVNIGKDRANELIKTLKEELNSKECVYGPEYDDESIKIPEGFFSGEKKSANNRSLADSRDNWYVTSKCDKTLYVKSTNSSEPEKEIVLPIYLTLHDKAVECSYKLISPGDEVQLIPSHFRQSINITKYV